MENKIDRIELAESIYSKLIDDESNAMELWSKSVDQIKLPISDLPTIDVLTCVYNAEEYIGHAIESVLFQSWPNIHLVIVTDPCTDKTIDIIKSYSEKFSNITLYENINHQGIISCFNKGLEYCNGDYIARMDLDDLIHPLRFEKQMDFLYEHPEIDVISCYMRIFNEIFQTKDITYRDDFDFQRITMLFYSPLSHAGSIFRAKVLKTIGYREDFKYAEDYDLWYKIMSKYKTAVYPEFLYLYRTHTNQVTNPRNNHIIKNSTNRILNNIFRDIQLVATNDEVNFHIEYLMFGAELSNLEDWFKYHSWLNRIIVSNKKSNYFNQLKLIQFIYTGYWQTPFNRFKGQISFMEFVMETFSKTNNISTSQKFKEIIKYILKK